MPFTPFHFGPAAVLRAVFPRHFSFTVFCFAQVITDAEVLIHMVKADGPLHRSPHTYAGASGVALAAWLAGVPLCRRILRAWDTTPGMPLKEYFDFSPDIPPVAAFTGAFVGAYSHVFLDSLIYADMSPLAPFRSENAAYGLIGPGALHGLCFLTGLLGIWLCARAHTRKR